MVSIPRLPLVPDLLRRSRIPSDLESVTTIGDESPAADGGMTADSVERIWKSANNLYRSGAHPAAQACVRRQRDDLLDRAIGHARGNGPSDPEDGEKVPVTTDTPFCIYSGAKAITAFLVHKLVERGLIALDDPVADHFPGYDKYDKGTITIGHVLAHR